MHAHRPDWATFNNLLVALLVVAILSPFVAQAFTANKYKPLGDYPVPQSVDNVLAGYDHPALYQGDTLYTTAIKCNNAGVDVPVSGSYAYVHLNPRYIVPQPMGVGVRKPGCQHFSYSNKLPDTLEPGMWRIEGVEATTDQLTQTKAWYTEDFEIVARP